MGTKTEDLRKGDIIFFSDDRMGDIVGVVTKIAHSVVLPEELKFWVKYIERDGKIACCMLHAKFDYEFSKVIRE